MSNDPAIAAKDVDEHDETPEELEARARQAGWVPEEEWRSPTPPPGGFVSAEDFLSRSSRGYSKALKAEISTLKTELAEIRSSADSFRQFASRAVERERREKESVLQQLEARREQAITEGDGRLAVQAERQIAAVREDLNRPEERQVDPAAMRVVQEFIRDNDWYEKNPHMRAWAEGRSVGLLQSGVPAGKAVLDAIANEARQVFPQHFQPQKAASVEAGRPRQMESFGRRSFDDLPDEAKRAYAQFARAMPGYTKAEFMAQYEWDT